MTTAHDTHGSEGWQAGVRRRLGLGRLLPLGSAEDGSWLAEAAAARALRAAGAAGTGGALTLGRVRVGPADDEEGGEDPKAPGPTGDAALAPVPPVPWSAQPPGPLRIEAEFEAARDEPLPALAQRLRAALLACARDGLGLRVEAVDLRVTGLRGDEGEPAAREPVAQRSGPVGPDGVPGVSDVPGVAHLTAVLGRGLSESSEGDLRVELATSAGHRVLDVARAVRVALARERPGARSVAVVVTEIAAAPEAARP
ncbi:hypothetical protein [Streptomyces sp. NBC_01497]|uniref:hypothetical protein n=1 Tax=Streptomyces sp. NBC_01497 TaxID=2903885 RepID=UPI002E35F899|nr:hypothetical protein [Streptomyces sp. NBC_01497]